MNRYLGGFCPGPLVRFNGLGQRRGQAAVLMMQGEGLFHYSRDIREQSPAVNKPLHRHFVGRIKHGGVTAAEPAGLIGQLQAGKTPEIRLEEFK